MDPYAPQNPEFAQKPQHPLANYQFSSDELRVLRECNRDSFFQRSLPLGFGFGTAAYFGVKHGYLQPSIRFGATPKVVVGVILGYFIGKFSYQQKCAEKLMRLPNSRLGEILRQRKQGGVMGNLAPHQDLSVGMALAPFTPNNADVYSDEHLYNSRSTSLNLDAESRPTISGLDDTYRPSLDNPSPQHEPEIPIEPVKPGTSYEELRRRNREDYMKKHQNPYYRPLSPNAPVVVREQEAPDTRSQEAETTQQKGRVNKYGDTWTN